MRRIAVGVSLSSFLATALLWLSTPDAFPHAWLAALFAWIGLPLGCMALMLIHALTGGGWGETLRLQFMAGARSLVLLPFFLVPLLLTARDLYPWLEAQPAALANAFYLNESFAVVRLTLYLSTWFILDWFILTRSNSGATLGAIAPAGLVTLALTTTFMSFDAAMSLEPRFASSVFGLLRMAEMGLLALSGALLAALQRDLAGEPLRQLARLLLALVILWAYFDFMQFLIVWQSNLPAEAAWYGLRLAGGWGALAGAIGVTHFTLPFFALLSPKAQSSRAVTAPVAALLLVSAFARSLWLVGPESKASSLMLFAILVAAASGMIAATAAFATTEAAPTRREGVRHERESA